MRFHHESHVLPTAALHVEHVLPVAWETHWSTPADENAVLVRNHLLHNIGNLTLLTDKLNPTLSNKAFTVKRSEIMKSLLALNAHFQDAKFAAPTPVWDEAAIRERAVKLFKVAVKIWPYGVPAPQAIAT